MIRRGTAAALMLLVALTTTAFAESIATDGDSVGAGDQAVIDLGHATPGADVHVDVSFRLECTGTNHVDATQSVRLTPGSRTIPPGGTFSVGSVTLFPSVGWPADGEPCPAGLAGVVGTRHMIVTAPLAPGTDLRYVFAWNQALLPTTATDAGVLGGPNPTVTFILDVSVDTPPLLHLPDDGTVEGDTTGGAIAAYEVSASDAEDATDPTPTCDPAAGTVLPLGMTTVDCSVTDSGGLTTIGSFDVTVVDTTAPTIVGMPADRALTTGDPGGTSLTFAGPTATDAVDPDPTVACVPASGTQLPVGPTTVTCTATDDSGNDASASFSVDVAFVEPVDPVVWSATWGEPVATDGGVFVANMGRTVPFKVEVFADGVEQASGNVRLGLATCAGAATLDLPLARDDGRWVGHLDTGQLAGPGCYVATVSVDGHAAGTVGFDLRGSTTAAKRRH